MPFMPLDALAEVPDGHLALGREPKTKDVFVINPTDRCQGLYILGVQGTGKSGLLQHLISQDVLAGNAVIVIDAHGDLVDDCLKQLPVWQLNNAYVLDLLDEAYPFGVNLFAHGFISGDSDRGEVVDRIMHVFDVLWDDVLTQQSLPRYLRMATLVLLENPGSTLVDMYAFLTDHELRIRMLKRVKDPTVKQFWRRYDKMGEAKQALTVQPLLTRLESLFAGRALVSNVVGQKVTSINFRKAIENHELLFIKLPVKKLRQDAELIGTILFSQIAAAIFSFGDRPPEQRPGVSLYVDEFQHFATPDFSELFSEGRKFGVRLTIAHQYRDQLPKYLQEATKTARTKVVFQTTPDDGREMAAYFPDAGGELEYFPRPTSYLLEHPEVAPHNVLVFIETYLRPLASHSRGGKITITNPEQDIAEFIHQGVLPNPKEDNPIPTLDALMKEVMRTRNPAVHIPMAAIAGFANCGRGFHKVLRGWFIPAAFAPKDFLPPRHLADSTSWKREPENAREQLFHFLYHLRATLAWLAEHPIVTRKRMSVTDIGRMISSLQRRAAFVRSGEHTGVIRTFDTPATVSGEELEKRVHAIRAQSRLKYAHPRMVIEGDKDIDVIISPEPEHHANRSDDDAAPPRWEDVS